MLTLAEDAQLEHTISTREDALALIQQHYPIPEAAQSSSR